MAIIGSRSFTDKSLLFHEINEYRKAYKNIDTIVSGGAKGADSLAAAYAHENGLDLKVFPANWSDLSEPCLKKTDKHGNAYNILAGLNRNHHIIAYSDIVIAFWDGKSSGTKYSISIARDLGKILHIIEYNLSLYTRQE